MAGSAPRSRKLASRIQRRVRIQDVQLPAAKVSNPRFRGKERKFPRHFKGHFSIGNVQVRILRGQPASPALRDFALYNATKARQWRAFANWLLVSGLRNLGLREGKSPIVSDRYLKYSRFRETGAGDRGSICTAWPSCSVTGEILRLGRRQIRNAEPALPHCRGA